MENTATRTASPTKLATGAWGARVTGPVQAGDTVTITTAAGKTWQARVTQVVRTGEGYSICATSSLDRAPSSRPAENYDANRFNGYGARRGGYVRACKTDGNCSSFGSGRSCGGHDCDGM